MKINELLFRHASLLASVGIATFAGVPCVSQLMNHRTGAPCAWFFLDGRQCNWEDTVLDIDIAGPALQVVSTAAPAVQGPLCTEELLNIILERSENIPWSEAFTRIRDSNRKLAGDTLSYRSAWFYRFMPYKPFFLVLMGAHADCR